MNRTQKEPQRSISTPACGGADHWNRRQLLKLAGLSGLSWLTPLGTILARQSERSTKTAKSLILLWLEGAPSQLETFDPHPGTEIAAGSLARDTQAKGIQIGHGFERLADQMHRVSLIRSMTSKEGDHERAIYNLKTGFRPDTTLVHPAIGSVICHHFEQADAPLVDIPRHVSIVPSAAASRGGYLGDQYDAFKIFDPGQPVPDVSSFIDQKRQQNRVDRLQSADARFMAGRNRPSTVGHQFGTHNLDAALRMMSSEQLAAFNVSDVPRSTVERYGDTSFGRGCLAALRLIQAGVRCVEVTLSGWDSHVENHRIQGDQIKILDPAFAALIEDLAAQDLLDSTMVLCGGEFGRTPTMNPLGGRDHWPHGFSMAIAGGGVVGGRVIGETSTEPSADANDHKKNLRDPQPVENLHATIFKAFGIDHTHELMTPVGRPMVISEGRPIEGLLS